MTSQQAIARANKAYDQRSPGWYVVNRITDIAVRGPMTFQAAMDARDQIWSRYGADDPAPSDLAVRMVAE